MSFPNSGSRVRAPSPAQGFKSVRFASLSRPTPRSAKSSLLLNITLRPLPAHVSVAHHPDGDERRATEHPLVEDLHARRAQAIETVRGRVSFIRAEPRRVDALRRESRASA